MGEHLNGIQGVAGSIPVSSTNTSLRTAGGACACGAPAIGSAGCGLDRSPGPVLALRSRGVSLLPPFGRETTHAASHWTLVGQQVLSQRSIAGTGIFRGGADYATFYS